MTWFKVDDTLAFHHKTVEAGLWRRVKGGYTFHEWAERQPSRQSIEDRRTVRAEAGRNGGLRSGQVRRAKQSKIEASASSKPEANASQVLEPPTRPVPSQPENPKSKTCA